MQFNLLNIVRQSNPLVHCMTNIVVANYTANGLLAAGASPLMSNNIHEVQDIQAFSQALLLNIGTVADWEVDAMIAAGKRANQCGIPVVLDPVGVGATPYRQAVIRRLLAEVQCSLIRGNVGEIAYLAEVDWQAKGVDAGNGQADVDFLARTVAQHHQCVVAVSGAIDVISDGNKLWRIHNGSALFPRITGSGCLLGAICAAFLGVSQPEHYLTACVEACTYYAVAGELAAQSLSATQAGTFTVALLDQLASLNVSSITQYAKLSNG